MDKYRQLGTVQMQIIPNCLKELAKQYIYMSKCKSQQLTLTGFQKSLNKCISSMNNAVIKFEEKCNVWTKLIV